MDNIHSILIMAVSAIVTAALRFLPFLIFGGKRETPPIVTYLGSVLPYAIMGMLIVFFMKWVSVVNASCGAPELISCSIVVALHVWKRNTLLSIA